MFGHLKPEELMNAIEGGVLNVSCRTHLNSCTACAAQLRSLESAYNGFKMEDTQIPEPDWDDFRDSVRLELLSRSVQRDSALRRWTGWPIRPVMAWGFSLAL